MEKLGTMTTSYKVMPGPEHFLPPSAASMGIRLPDPGQGHIHGTIVSEEEAMEEAARQFPWPASSRAPPW